MKYKYYLILYVLQHYNPSNRLDIKMNRNIKKT